MNFANLYLGSDLRFVIISLAIVLSFMILGLLTNINQLFIGNLNRSNLELNFGNLIFRGILLVYVELTILGLVNFLNLQGLIVISVLNLIGVIYYFYLSLHHKMYFKYQNKSVFALLVILSILLVPNSLSVPLGWDSLAFHLNLPRFYFHNSFYEMDSNVTHLGYFLGSDILNLIPVLLNDYRLASFLNILVMALILNTLFQLRKLINSISIPILLILFFIFDTTFLKFPITSFNVDYFLILIGLNLTSFVKYHWDLKSGSNKVYFAILIFAFSYAKLYSFTLVIIWIFLYVALSIKRKIRIRKDVTIPLIIGLLPSAIWLIRNILFFKNPFYPYFDQIFNWDQSSKKWTDPFNSFLVDRFQFIELMTRFQWSRDSYILIYEFSLVILTLLCGVYLIRKYLKNTPLVSFILSSLIVYLFIYWSTGDELNRYRHFILWMIIYLFIITPKKNWLQKFILIVFFISSTINFSYSWHTYWQNIKNNLKTYNTSDQIFAIKTYDQYKLIKLAHDNYRDDRVLLIGDNRLALLPINFRAADTSRFSVLNYLANDTTEKILVYLKQEKIDVLILSSDWGEPAKWNKQLWFELFQNPQICDAYDFEGLLVCEIKY